MDRMCELHSLTLSLSLSLSIRNIQNLSVMRLKLCKMKEKKLQEKLSLLESTLPPLDSPSLSLDDSGGSTLWKVRGVRKEREKNWRERNERDREREREGESMCAREPENG